MIEKPLVSIVIPTYNSEKTLKMCLISVRNQTFRNTEVIIVDNFSKDKTVEIAREHGAKIIVENLRVSAARNRGLKEAKGQYVLSLDSDMLMSKNVIEECVKLIENDRKIGGIIIPERSVGDSFWMNVRDFERSFYVGTEMESSRFFNKSLMEEVGGYDEDVTFFEESTLPQKIEKAGYNIKARIPNEILHYEGNFSLWDWLKKKYFYGKSASKYKQKFGAYAYNQMNIFYRLSLFLRFKRFYSNFILAFGVIILKILEYLAAGIGFVQSKVET